ncbi:glycosyltransferase [Pseudomonadales bacterium]|nr:glycosyltransferase [Pseudomonadales bacterium]
MNNLIAIIIPTYNRDHYLNKLVSQWITEIDALDLNDIICIKISDNSSTDRTKEILEELHLQAVKHKVTCNYSINEKNIGLGRNVAKLINSVDSEYTWTMGDDDFLNFWTIQSIVAILEDLNHDLVFLNSAVVFNQDDYDGFLLSSSSDRPLTSNLGVQNISLSDENILDIDKYVGFVSSMIVRSEILKKSIENIDEKYLQNNYYPKLYNYRAVELADKLVETIGPPIVMQNCVSGSYFYNDGYSLRKTFVTDIHEVFYELQNGDILKLTKSQLDLIAKKYFSNRSLLVSLKYHRNLFWSDIKKSTTLSGVNYYWPRFIYILPRTLVMIIINVHQQLKRLVTRL